MRAFASLITVSTFLPKKSNGTTHVKRRRTTAKPFIRRTAVPQVNRTHTEKPAERKRNIKRNEIALKAKR